MPKRKDKTQSPEERLQEMLAPESEQPYPVPENWCWTTIDAINQYQGMSLNPRENPDKKYELYSVPSLDNNFPEIVLGKNIGSTKQLVQKGDVLLCKINPRLNRVWQVHAYTSDDLLASSEWIVVRNHNLNAGYLRFYFQSSSFRKYMLSNVSGVGGSLMRAKPKYVGTYPIPIPPLPEQQRIVDRIESLFSKLDAAKTKAQAVVDSHESRKAAILHKAFTGELTKKWREKKNQSFAEWTQTDIKHVIDSIRYGTSEKSDYSNTGTPVLRIPNIGAGNIDFSDIKFLSQEPDDASLVHKGDILIIRSNGSRELVGNAALIGDLDRAYAYASFLIRLRPSDCINPNFLVLYLNSIDARRQMFNSAKSSAGINNINSQEIGRISFHMPGLEEQEAIVSLIENILDKEQESVDIANIMIERVDAMKKSILSRAFRGELGTNDPREESAVGLLMQDIEEK